MERCTRCKKGKTVVELPYANQGLCSDCFIEFFERRVRRTIRRHELLEPDDRVCVALSGGKDSMVALTLLKELSEKAPKSEIFALMIDEGAPGYRDRLVKTASEYCGELGVPCHVYSFKEELGKTIAEIMEGAGELDSPMPACSYCGVFRRQLLNSKARELGATKLATGHNLDDECQTGLMNFLRGDVCRIARAGAVVGAVRSELFIPRIKPLREAPESEVALYAELRGIPAGRAVCPFSKDAFRVSMRGVLEGLEERYPGTRYQLMSSIDELIPILRGHYLEKGGKLKVCRSCGEVSSGEECKFCRMKKELGLD